MRLDGVMWCWLPLSRGLWRSPSCRFVSVMLLPSWWLWSILFMFDEPFVILFALGLFASDDEFVSLAQLISLLLTFNVLLLLLLLTPLERWVRSFSSRRHFALWKLKVDVCKVLNFPSSNQLCIKVAKLPHLRLENQTWILASGNPILTAKRSRAKTLQSWKKVKFCNFNSSHENLRNSILTLDSAFARTPSPGCQFDRWKMKCDYVATFFSASISLDHHPCQWSSQCLSFHPRHRKYFHLIGYLLV